MSVTVIDALLRVLEQTGQMMGILGAVIFSLGAFFPEAMEPYRKALRANWAFIEKHELISLLDKTIFVMIEGLRTQTMSIFTRIMRPLPLAAMLIISPFLSYQANVLGLASIAPGQFGGYLIAALPWALLLLATILGAGAQKDARREAYIAATDGEKAFEFAWNKEVLRRLANSEMGPEFFEFWAQKDKTYQAWIRKVSADANEFLEAFWWRSLLSLLAFLGVAIFSFYVPYILHSELVVGAGHITSGDLAIIILLVSPQFFVFVFSVTYIWRLLRLFVSQLFLNNTLYQSASDIQNSGFWAISFVIALLISILMTFFAVQLGILIEGNVEYEATAQLLVSNYIADGLTLVSTVIILRWAIRGNALLRLPIAVFFDLLLAAMLAILSVMASHAFTTKSVDLTEAMNILQGLSFNGTEFDLGPMFWVMHTTFIPTVFYLLSIMAVWYGKIFLLFTTRILRIASERDRPLEYTGSALTALGFLLMAAAV